MIMTWIKEDEKGYFSHGFGILIKEQNNLVMIQEIEKQKIIYEENDEYIIYKVIPKEIPFIKRLWLKETITLEKNKEIIKKYNKNQDYYECTFKS